MPTAVLCFAEDGKELAAHVRVAIADEPLDVREDDGAMPDLTLPRCLYHVQ